MAESTDEEFVTAWMTHATVSEVAEALGVTYAAVAQRASRFRKAGVKLPSKLLHPRKDVAALNALVEKCRAPAGEPKLMDGPEMMPWAPEDSDA